MAARNKELTDRPFFHNSTKELKELFLNEIENAEVLQTLVEELKHRSKPKAMRLLARVEKKKTKLESRNILPNTQSPNSTRETTNDLCVSSASGTENAEDSEVRSKIVNASPEERILVEAGPGTGKTEIAARRLASLLDSGVRPSEILVLSFSRSAVKTLTSRLTKIDNTSELVLEELRHLSIRTFDSWAFRQLRLLGYPAGQLLNNTHDENIKTLTSKIKADSTVDVRECIGHRRHLIVDEFQDLPGVRGDLVLALLELLCPVEGAACGFTILGDPAQAIYGFAARQDDSRSFPSPAQYWQRVLDYYGENVAQFELKHNFRSSPEISRLSSHLREILLSDRPEAEKLEFMKTTFSELPSHDLQIGPEWLEEVSFRNHAILTRTNGEALRVLQQLVGRDVDGPSTKVRLKAGNFATLPTPWIGALMRKVQDTVVSKSRFEKIYDYVSRLWSEAQQTRIGLPPKEIAWQRLLIASGASERATSFELAALRDHLSWPDAFPDDQAVSDGGVFITTVHQSKGMEFEGVSVLDMGDVDGGETIEETQEHASVGYVALTRAEKTVHKIHPKEFKQPPMQWQFPSGRVRHRHWWNGWMNLAMGLEGDIDPFGFVDPDLLGGAEGVEDLQDFFLRKASNLESHKVILKMNFDENTEKVRWHIHLQDGNKPGRLVGRTADQLSRDIFMSTKKQGYKFPYYIYNLRIGGVGTVTSNADLPLQVPEARSRLWLGLSLFGTGDFPMKKRK